MRCFFFDRIARTIFVTACISCCGFANAHEPLTDQQIQAMRNDGEYEECLQRAKRLAPHKVGAGLNQRAVYKIQKANLKASGLSDAEISAQIFGGRMMAFPYAAKPELRSTGLVKTLTVLVDFKDQRAATIYPGLTADKFQQNIYGGGTPEAQTYKPYESCHNYYLRASENKVDLRGDVLGWYNFAKNRTAYKPNTTTGLAENQAIFDMAKEALASYDANHDFAQYDNDNDGDIDQLTIIYAGPKGAWSSFWWAYRWEFFVNDASTTTFDGKRLKQFVFQFVSTRDANSSDFDPRTLIHETGHAFGLPDYYDYEAGNGPDGGVGGLDMMDANLGNHNAFSRWLLDWIQPVVIGTGQPAQQTLAGSGANAVQNKAIAIFPGLTSSSAPGQEMFIVEHRSKSGNDAGFDPPPGDGVLVWHVIATPNATSDDFVMDNSYSDKKLIRLVRADTSVDFGDDERATAAVYFKPGKEFEPPASDRADGSPTHIVVRQIAQNGDSVNALVGFELPVDATPPVAAAAPSSADDSSQTVDLAKIEKLAAEMQDETPAQLAARWNAAWSKYGEQLEAREAQVILQLILASWASKDGEAAAKVAMQLPKSELSVEAFPRVMESWAVNDPRGASSWYFNPDQKESFEAAEYVAGPKFAQAVFDWSAANDPRQAVASLEKLSTLPELWGAVGSIEKAFENEGISDSNLRQQIETLKNAKLVLATQRLQNSVKVINAAEDDSKDRDKAYDRLWSQIDTLKAQIADPDQLADAENFVALQIQTTESAPAVGESAPAEGAPP